MTISDQRESIAWQSNGGNVKRSSSYIRVCLSDRRLRPLRVKDLSVVPAPSWLNSWRRRWEGPNLLWAAPRASSPTWACCPRRSWCTSPTAELRFTTAGTGPCRGWCGLRSCRWAVSRKTAGGLRRKRPKSPATSCWHSWSFGCRCPFASD